MATLGYATLPVILSMQGITGEIDKQIIAPLTAGGQKAGKDAGAAVAAGLAASKAAVEKASGDLAAARKKEEDAAGKVRVAEAQLQALRDKGVTDVGKLAAAEEKVAAAQRNHATAADKTRSAVTSLTTAEDRAAEAARRVGTESQNATTGVSNLGTAAESSQSRLGAFTAAGAAGLAALAAGAVAAATSLISVGQTFGEASKTLTFTTGATGEALDGLMDSVKNIAKASPKGIGDISTVLSQLAVRTKLTGEPLEALTKQVIKLSGMGPQFATDINGATAAMAAFGVSGSDMGPMLDQLFKVSQKTGVSMDRLTAAAVKGAPQFQQFGFGLADTASLMGSLDQAGVNSEAILTGLNKAMLAFSAAGREPKAALTETIKSMQDFQAAGNDMAAIDLAKTIFGAKGGGQFAAAVKSGAIGLDTLTASMDDSTGAILDQGGAIPTMASAWAMFKNNILIAIEPIATRVFKVFTDGIAFFRSTGVAVIQAFSSAFGGLLDGGYLDGITGFFKQLKSAADGVVSILFKGDFKGPLFGLDEDSGVVNFLFTLRDTATQVWGQITGGLRAMVEAFATGSTTLTQSGVAGFLEQLGVKARTAFDIFTTYGLPVLREVATVVGDVAAVALPLLWTAFETGLDVVNRLSNAVSAVVGFFDDHKVAAAALATAIGIGLLPTLVSATVSFGATAAAAAASGVAAVTSAAANTAAWLALRVEAGTSAAVQVAAQYKIVAGWVAAGAAAVAQAAISTAAWVASTAKTIAALAAQAAAFVAQKTVMIAGSVATGIATAAQWAFNAALAANPIGLVIAAIAALVAGLVWFFTKTEIGRKIWETVWGAIQSAASATWDFLKGVFEKLGAAWQTVSDAAGAAKDWIVDKWNGMVDFVTGLPGKIASAARGMWDGIKEAFKAAVNFIIDGWNAIEFKIPGFKVGPIGYDGFTLGLPDIPRLKGGGPIAGRTKDGRFWGPGTGTSDSLIGVDASGIPIVRVSTREGVVTEAAMDAGGAPVVAALNAGWVPSAEFLHGMLPGYQTGGWVGERLDRIQQRQSSTPPVTTTTTPGSDPGGELGGGTVNQSIWDYISAKVPDATLNSGYRAGDPGYHGIKKAIDVGGPLSTVAEAAFAIKDQLAQIIFDDATHPWYNVRQNELGTGVATAQGQAARDIYGAGTMAGHADHVHIAAESALSQAAQTAVTQDNPALTTSIDSSATSSPDIASAADAGSTAATGGGTRLKTLRELGSDLGGILADGLVESLNLPKFIADPNVLMEGDDGSNVRTSTSSGTSASTSTTSTTARDEPVAAGAPDGRNGRTGSDLYAFDISSVAKDMGFGRDGAIIGTATALVESALKMYANSNVPQSLQLPHDAVGSDHDSVGLFQQRFPMWGPLDVLMDSVGSARLFYDALGKIDWKGMDPGAAAQAVQRSAFPGRYSGQMGAAADWVAKTGLFDTGGWLQPGQLALSMLTKPEPLLPADKWDIAEGAIGAVSELVRAGGGRGDVHNTYIANGYTAGDITSQWDRKQWARTGGYDGRHW